MKVLVILGACLLFASALPVEDDDGRIYTMTTTSTTTTSTTSTPSTTTAKPATTLPCQTPPPANIPCPPCVSAYCKTNECNQALPLPFPGDCTKFCMCESEGSKQIDCPDGLEFNAQAYVCDWPSTSNCTPDNTYDILPGCEKQ